MTIKDAADYISTGVSSHQIASLYAFKPDRGGYINCPFHPEKTASLKLHKSGWYCYGCGRGGDAITFVMLMEDCSYIDAVKAIDQQLSLGLIYHHKFNLMGAVNKSKKHSEMDAIITRASKAITTGIECAERQLLRWWDVYRDACSTAPKERTGAQWDAIRDGREWCMYYEDIMRELQDILEEVKTWRISP